jgi:hypothetical protein
MLSVMGCFAANTADSLLHRNCTDRILMQTDLKRVPNVASPVTMPPSSEQYDDMRSAGRSSRPPPQNNNLFISCCDYPSMIAYSKED